MTDDLDLVKQFKINRTPEAFEQLVGQYLPFVRKLMAKMAINEHDADDITQEVFLKVYRFIDAFRGEAKFTTWLCRIAMNTAYSTLKKKSRMRITNADIDLNNMTAASNGQASQAVKNDLESVTQDAVRALPMKLRSVITLVAMEGLDYDQASKIEGCSRAVLYWRMHKARKILAKRLGRYL
jgi:RNA polymerase sigma-70 factor, ECF subfamily